MLFNHILHNSPLPTKERSSENCSSGCRVHQEPLSRSEGL
ncbi:uncharacterized protein METZ01_LOCUS210877, partial [marine metagenome]